MLLLIQKLWSKLSLLNKILIFIALGCFIAFTIMSIKFVISEHKRIKQIEYNYKEIKISIKKQEKKEQEIINKIKESNLKHFDENKAINKKQKADEKIIDSMDISNDDIFEFISKHQKR